MSDKPIEYVAVNSKALARMADEFDKLRDQGLMSVQRHSQFSKVLEELNITRIPSPDQIKPALRYFELCGKLKIETYCRESYSHCQGCVLEPPECRTQRRKWKEELIKVEEQALAPFLEAERDKPEPPKPCMDNIIKDELADVMVPHTVADKIRRLTAENARLREALEKIKAHEDTVYNGYTEAGDIVKQALSGKGAE